MEETLPLRRSTRQSVIAKTEELTPRKKNASTPVKVEPNTPSRRTRASSTTPKKSLFESVTTPKKTLPVLNEEETPKKSKTSKAISNIKDKEGSPKKSDVTRTPRRNVNGSTVRAGVKENISTPKKVTYEVGTKKLESSEELHAAGDRPLTRAKRKTMTANPMIEINTKSLQIEKKQDSKEGDQIDRSVNIVNTTNNYSDIKSGFQRGVESCLALVPKILVTDFTKQILKEANTADNGKEIDHGTIERCDVFVSKSPLKAEDIPTRSPKKPLRNSRSTSEASLVMNNIVSERNIDRSEDTSRSPKKTNDYKARKSVNSDGKSPVKLDQFSSKSHINRNSVSVTSPKQVTDNEDLVSSRCIVAIEKIAHRSPRKMHIADNSSPNFEEAALQLKANNTLFGSRDKNTKEYLNSGPSTIETSVIKDSGMTPKVECREKQSEDKSSSNEEIVENMSLIISNKTDNKSSGVVEVPEETPENAENISETPQVNVSADKKSPTKLESGNHSEMEMKELKLAKIASDNSPTKLKDILNSDNQNYLETEAETFVNSENVSKTISVETVTDMISLKTAENSVFDNQKHVEASGLVLTSLINDISSSTSVAEMSLENERLSYDTAGKDSVDVVVQISSETFKNSDNVSENMCNIDKKTPTKTEKINTEHLNKTVVSDSVSTSNSDQESGILLSDVLSPNKQITMGNEGYILSDLDAKSIVTLQASADNLNVSEILPIKIVTYKESSSKNAEMNDSGTEPNIETNGKQNITKPEVLTSPCKKTALRKISKKTEDTDEAVITDMVTNTTSKSFDDDTETGCYTNISSKLTLETKITTSVVNNANVEKYEKVDLKTVIPKETSESIVQFQNVKTEIKSSSEVSEISYMNSEYSTKNILKTEGISDEPNKFESKNHSNDVTDDDLNVKGIEKNVKDVSIKSCESNDVKHVGTLEISSINVTEDVETVSHIPSAVEMRNSNETRELTSKGDGLDTFLMSPKDFLNSDEESVIDNGPLEKASQKKSRTGVRLHHSKTHDYTQQNSQDIDNEVMVTNNDKNMKASVNISNVLSVPIKIIEENCQNKGAEEVYSYGNSSFHSSSIAGGNEMEILGAVDTIASKGEKIETNYSNGNADSVSEISEHKEMHDNDPKTFNAETILKEEECLFQSGDVASENEDDSKLKTESEIKLKNKQSEIENCSPSASQSKEDLELDVVVSVKGDICNIEKTSGTQLRKPKYKRIVSNDSTSDSDESLKNIVKKKKNSHKFVNKKKKISLENSSSGTYDSSDLADDHCPPAKNCGTENKYQTDNQISAKDFIDFEAEVGEEWSEDNSDSEEVSSSGSSASVPSDFINFEAKESKRKRSLEIDSSDGSDYLDSVHLLFHSPQDSFSKKKKKTKLEEGSIESEEKRRTLNRKYKKSNKEVVDPLIDSESKKNTKTGNKLTKEFTKTGVFVISSVSPNLKKTKLPRNPSSSKSSKSVNKSVKITEFSNKGFSVSPQIDNTSCRGFLVTQIKSDSESKKSTERRTVQSESLNQEEKKKEKSNIKNSNKKSVKKSLKREDKRKESFSFVTTFILPFESTPKSLEETLNAEGITYVSINFVKPRIALVEFSNEESVKNVLGLYGKLKIDDEPIYILEGNSCT